MSYYICYYVHVVDNTYLLIFNVNTKENRYYYKILLNKTIV